jgi:hypothetical protein
MEKSRGSLECRPDRKVITYALAIVVMYFYMSVKIQMWNIGKPCQLILKTWVRIDISYQMVYSTNQFSESLSRQCTFTILGFSVSFLGTATIVIQDDFRTPLA